jgi:hypothetical protein
MLRGFLEDNDVPCFIQGENHRSMLGMLGAYIDIRVLVPPAHAARAAEFIGVFRADAEVIDPVDFAEQDETDDALEDLSGRAVDEVAGARVKKPMVAVGFSLAIGLGFGHFYAGAPRRGAALAGLQLVSLGLLPASPPLAAAVHFGARLVDAVGAAATLRRQRAIEPAPHRLPRARTVRRAGD